MVVAAAARKLPVDELRVGVNEAAGLPGLEHDVLAVAEPEVIEEAVTATGGPLLRITFVGTANDDVIGDHGVVIGLVARIARAQDDALSVVGIVHHGVVRDVHRGGRVPRLDADGAGVDDNVVLRYVTQLLEVNARQGPAALVPDVEDEVLAESVVRLRGVAVPDLAVHDARAAVGVAD